MKELIKEQYVLPEIKVDIVETDIITYSDDKDGDVNYPLLPDKSR